MKTLDRIFQDIDTLSKNSEFLPTGLHQVDRFLDGGFMRKELIVLGGFTGSGKSFLAGQIFHNVAMNGFKSAYLSLEISTEMVLSRLIGQTSNLKATRIMAGLLDLDEDEIKNRAKAEIIPYSEFMHFTDKIYKLEEVEETIINNNYDFIVVDFIQNLMTGEKDEYSAMTLASLRLQSMAKEHNCCIMVVSQLSNSANKSGYLEYKGSGGIAMVADLGFFITRPADNDIDYTKLVLTLKKNRRGISGVNFPFNFQTPGGLIV